MTTSVANPEGVAAADFNGDNKNDFAVINNVSNGTVLIYLNNACGRVSGAPSSFVNLGVGTFSDAIAVGDLTAIRKWTWLYPITATLR